MRFRIFVILLENKEKEKSLRSLFLSLNTSYVLMIEEIKKKDNSLPLSLSLSVYASLNTYICYRMTWNIKETNREGLSLSHSVYLHACPWGLLVNSFNWGGFVKDLYCFLFFLLSNLCAIPTTAMVVKHDRVQFREKERKKVYISFSLCLA